MRKLLNAELNRKSNEEFKSSSKIPLIIVLDNVRSMNNIGSAFRTADSFLCQEICLCGVSAKPPHREIQKTALGATETVNWSYFEKTNDCITYLQNNKFNIISIEQTENAIPLDNFPFRDFEKVALVFGNEVFGVDQEIINKSNKVIEIPQSGTKHSLNISVALGIVTWEFYKILNRK